MGQNHDSPFLKLELEIPMHWLRNYMDKSAALFTRSFWNDRQLRAIVYCVARKKQFVIQNLASSIS